MDIAELLNALQQPRAYSHPADQLTVLQTHISVVVLAGPFAYKIKKPVQFDFLDFSTLEKRHHYCQQEVLLNRRLAPEVYLGVVPIVHTPQGLRVNGAGEVVEWAVQMQRLDEGATLATQLADLKRPPLALTYLDRLAQRLAQFHAHAAHGPEIARFGRLEVVAGNVRENFAETREQVGRTVHEKVFARVRRLSEEQLITLGPLIEERAGRGVPRDTHGDLRLGHVYLFPDRMPPGDLVILDCIEFNERFRYSDPIADVAFLVMDLLHVGQRDLADSVGTNYLTAAGDLEGAQLLSFYVAYRAVVRAKVSGLKVVDPELPGPERQRALASAQAHWLLALSVLEGPACRPCLLLVGGPPGTGKSTLARALGEVANFQVLRSDVVRKELVGIPLTTSPSPEVGLYSPAMTERTYSECLRRARVALLEGERVLMDANFRVEQQRLEALHLALELNVPFLWFDCQAEPETVRQRLHGRTGDVSDADWAIYQQVLTSWEPPGEVMLHQRRALATDGTSDEVLAAALEVLRQAGLAGT